MEAQVTNARLNGRCSGSNSSETGRSKELFQFVSSLDSQSGPFHHKILSTSSEDLIPRDARSLGFSLVRTCLHCLTFVISSI